MKESAATAAAAPSGDGKGVDDEGSGKTSSYDITVIRRIHKLSELLAEQASSRLEIGEKATKSRRFFSFPFRRVPWSETRKRT